MSKRPRPGTLWLRAILIAAEILATAEAFVTFGRREAASRLDLLTREVARLRAENELLRSRLLRTSGARRARYTMVERLEILWQKLRHGLSLRATACAFALEPSTIMRWLEAIDRGRRRVVRAMTAASKLPHVVEELVRLLRFEQPAWGTRRIAQVLARLGVAVSRSSVQRLVRRKPRRPAGGAGAACATDRKHPGVKARRPNRVWLIDFTSWTLLGGLLEVHVGAVLDAFTRTIVSIGIRRGRPSGRWACELVSSAIEAARATPRHLITDKGVQFRSRNFRRLLQGTKITRRFGAVGRHGSIARIERFWRSLKSEWRVPTAVLWFAPRFAAASLRSWIEWYNVHRPHQGLGGRTPDEVRRGRDVRAPIQIDAHRRWQLERELIDGDSGLPVYKLRRAA